MVIYEVNLSIDADVYADYMVWLKEHVKEMLQFPGFIQVSLFEQESKEPDGDFSQEKLTVQYQIEDRDSLEKYLTEFAPKMRGEGINRFKDKFSADRRIFNVQDIILK